MNGEDSAGKDKKERWKCASMMWSEVTWSGDQATMASPGLVTRRLSRSIFLSFCFQGSKKEKAKKAALGTTMSCAIAGFVPVPLC